ncbi:trehalose/maltose hydrolase or phosphorylase [Halobacteroides halobius DSM 5150]|uniref:Trehalose/maltose hydrolase or phosphorylase n=1 Tax=Halobacteroides halobius (strain ATCC 35273 / DSM 5150 / MD-1) TaxID=748449 RepID=L0KB31_HALHC|nr:glycoside hydrolase family 65 protein [Halobacteroides halobius]AGB41745.1 trehalose/maltose hydrolase or phosphorylase [Halobacteroides halobius DSM 5150]
MSKVKCDNWRIIEDTFNTEYLQHYETIFTLGNGYLGTRGSLEESYSESKPGTFIAGTFDKAPEEVTELPNVANWLAIDLNLAGENFDLKQGQILDYNRSLNLKQGILTREVTWQSPAGNVTELRFERFVSIADQHKLGLKVAITPKNYSGEIKYKSNLDGQITNSGTQHFIDREKCAIEQQGIYLVQRTQESEIDIALAAMHNIKSEGRGLKIDNNCNIGRRKVFYQGQFNAVEEEQYTCEKLVSIYTSRDVANPKEEAVKSVQEAIKVGYDYLANNHISAWAKEWDRSDIKLDGPTFDQLAIRFGIFHQLQMAHKSDDRISIAAKALSGEGYRGHVFWDNEIFNLPFFIYNYPAAAKTLLKYRYNTLDGARQKAKDNGYQGAQFAWESARTGEETTPKWGGLDIETGKPIRIWCGDIEEHITADVAYAIYHYYQATGDEEFLQDYGAEILLETARFWASRVEYNQGEDRYEITGVIGPDEYSEHVDNNVYTNMMVQFNLEKALEIVGYLADNNPQVWEKLVEKLNLDEEELTKWQEITNKIFINYDENKKLYIQYEGFLEQDNIDDKIKEAKEKGIHLPALVPWKKISEESQALKQADVVMLQYLLSDKFSVEEKKTAWELYEPKTMHDSSLSPAIHSIVAVEMGDLDKAYDYFKQGAKIDLTLGGSEAGLHAASLGGLWQSVVNGFAGMRREEGKLRFNPTLPENWNQLEFSIIWKGVELIINLTRDSLTLKASSNLEDEIEFNVYNNSYILLPQEEKTIELSQLEVKIS